jgi:hypothetical protein
MRRFGVDVMSENGSPLPPSVSTASAMVAFSILAGNFSGQMLQSGLVWTKVPFPEAEEYQVVGDFMKSLSGCAGELSKATPALNWSGYYSATTELLQSRSMRCRLYPSVLALLNAAQVRLGLSCSWVDDSTPAEIMQASPLIVDGGSLILTQESERNILTYVENGGVFVCDTLTGMHEPAVASPTHRLLKSLGAESIEPSEQNPAGGGIVLKKQASIRWSGESGARLLNPDDPSAPPVWERPWGKGKFLIAGGEIDWPASSSWLSSLVEAHAGRPPYKIDGDESISGILHGPGADYVVIRPLLLVNGRENQKAEIGDIRRAGNARVRISGIPPDVVCTEMIGRYPVLMENGTASVEVPRAMLAIVRIPRPGPRPAAAPKSL